MTLVDTATWVDFMHDRDTEQTRLLARLLPVEQIILGDLVRYELMRGFRRDSDFDMAYAALQPLECHALVNSEVTQLATDNFRILRNRYQTMPDTTSMMLGSYCILSGFPLLFSNPGFAPMVEHLGLIDRLAHR